MPTTGEPQPGASGFEAQGPAIKPAPSPESGIAASLAGQRREGVQPVNVLQELAGQGAEAPARPEQTERTKQVEQLQALLHKFNNDPTVGRRLLAEIPLGDGTDRVAMVLRPSAIMEIDWVRQRPNDLSAQIADVTPNIKDELDATERSSLVRAAQHKMVAVLPEIGPVMITPADQAERGGAFIPGSLKSEVHRIMSTQGGAANGTFMEMMQKDGLKFVQHGGMEKDDSASYVTPENTETRHATILRKEGESHWEGEEVPGVSPVRGQSAAELFDASVIAARAGAREEQLYQGPSPDHMIGNSLANLQAIADR